MVGTRRIAAVAAVAGLLAAPVAGAAELRVRKSVTKLTHAERSAFVDAIKELKATASPVNPEISWYDQFVGWHVYLSRCRPDDFLMTNTMAGHAGPMFLPWHREFLLLFEDALREVSGKPVTVPYWDWTNPAAHASVFSDDFMGGDGDPAQDHAVTSGPFRKGKWTVDVQPYGSFARPVPDYLQRKMAPVSRFPKPEEIDAALATELYDVGPWDDASDPAQSFRNNIEGFRDFPRLPVHGWTGCPPNPDDPGSGQTGAIGAFTPGALHNIVHWLVGGVLEEDPVASRVGTMDNLGISPADPTFWLHHAMIDQVWARWQDEHGIETYASERDANRIDDQLHPFEEAGVVATPRTVADFRALGYTYDSVGATRSQLRAAGDRARSARTRRLLRAHRRFRALCRVAA